MIKNIPKDIPTTAGVYFFKNPKGAVLYIGKAKNLNNRILSYFRGTHDPRIQHMLDMAYRVDWQETGSEIEALILESKLIKQHKTKYNISMRDDKNYAYALFTDDPFPRVLVTHQPGEQNAIGPFVESRALKLTLRLLRKFYPYCTCPASRDPAKRDKPSHKRPCLNSHLGLCPGYCCFPATAGSRAAYRKNISTIRAILTGRKKDIFSRRIFENARVIQELAHRDRSLAEMKNIFGLPSIPRRIEGYDISNIQGLFATGSMVVFEDGVPNTNEYRKFKIHAPASPDDTLMLSEMLERRLRHPEWPAPDVLLIDGGRGQLNSASAALTKSYHLKANTLIPILSIAKGKQEIFSTTLPSPIPLSSLPEAVRQLILHIDAEAHRFAITYYRKLHRKGNLKK